MAYYSNPIPKIKSYSLTDLHDFDDCPFRFFVRHHLDRKYDIDESNGAIALGHLLDQSIKKFHNAKYYGCEVEDLVGIVRAAARDMGSQVEVAKERGKRHFYELTIPFLTEEVEIQAIKVFQDYYLGVDKKIRPQIAEVGFCDYVISVEGDPSTGSGQDLYRLWGGPDTLEMGRDGMPEVVDYKSRQNIEKGKSYMDMDLMPKIYTLLCKQKLIDMGFSKARFVVRFWQDPGEEGFYEEFDLTAMTGIEFVFAQKITEILRVTDFSPCGKQWCAACKSDKRAEFVEELEKLGLKVISGEE